MKPELLEYAGRKIKQTIGEENYKKYILEAKLKDPKFKLLTDAIQLLKECRNNNNIDETVVRIAKIVSIYESKDRTAEMQEKPGGLAPKPATPITGSGSAGAATAKSLNTPGTEPFSRQRSAPIAANETTAGAADDNMTTPVPTPRAGGTRLSRSDAVCLEQSPVRRGSGETIDQIIAGKRGAGSLFSDSAQVRAGDPDGYSTLRRLSYGSGSEGHSK